MRRISAIFFDLDGTLVDTAPDFHAGINRLRASRGLPPLPYAPIRAAVSDGARAVIEAGGFPGAEAGSEAAEALRQAFLDDYQQHLADSSRVFAGLDKALDDMEQAGCRWGVVTNKPSRYTTPLMAALGLAGRSAATVCADEVVNTKPHPEPMFKAASLAGVDPATCVYVGDHARDIEAGRRAGMFTIAAGWGYLHTPDAAAGWQADLVCATPDDFTAWLRQALR